ncbi:MAG TPA: hypothetical protein VN625_06615 [Desulfuromonadaceae bacterium]|nr:hypothetical protein [Desulfuromonadaceae bacterium]
MKTWLYLSLALNAILVAALALHKDHPAPAVVQLSPATLVTATPPAALKGPAITLAAKNTLPAGWAQALRDAGVPDKLVNSIAAADYETRWQKQLEVMKKKFTEGLITEDEFTKFIKSHDADEETALRTSLGEAGFRQWDREKTLHSFDLEGLNLSDADTDALYQLQKGFDQQRRDMTMSKLNGDIDEATLESQTEAKQDEYEKKLKSLLGDARYASLQPGDSAVGDLRRNLAKLSASDEQVDAMMKGQQQWKDSRAKVEADLQAGKITSQQYDEQTKTIDAARDQLYQQTLGANAYADFQKNQDGRYQTMQRYASAWNLNDDDINHLYSAIQFAQNSVHDYQQRAKDTESKGEPVDWDAVQKILHDYSQQTDETLQKYLGQERFTKLKQAGALETNP